MSGTRRTVSASNAARDAHVNMSGAKFQVYTHLSFFLCLDINTE